MHFIVFVFIFLKCLYCSLDLDCLVFFGDSLSDNGNLKKLTLGMKPDKRYYKGRFTNGPVWPEYFEKLINVKNVENWAYGGATTDNRLTYKYRAIPSLCTQLNWFKLKNNSCFNDKPSKHLVSYMVGANNYLNSTIKPELTIKNIKDHINFLINDLGFSNLFITDLPPIHDTPAFKGNWLKPDETSNNFHDDPNIKSKVNLHNKLVEELINELKSKYPQINFYFLQFGQFWERSKQLNPFNSANWNTELPCFDGSKDNQGCENPQDYFFLDTNHPITEVHKFMADEIANFLVANWK